MQDFIYG